MDTTEWIEEYLALRDDGVEVDVEAFVERAGQAGPELRKQLAVFQRLEELAQTLDTDQSKGAALTRVGPFRILSPLGEGGLARVFLAEDERLGRKVALKVLHPTAVTVGSLGELNSVAREGRSLAKLEHPSIVKVHEVDVADGQAYVAMEYIEGPSLFEVLCQLREPSGAGSAAAAARALTPTRARCLLVAGVARALHACHESGVVHRDVKPGNILLDGSHRPKLVDFGLAHLASGEAPQGHTEALVGTPQYIAPEQVDNERTGASPASDQFSLGVVLYELLTLVNPFASETRSATMTAISRARPAPPRSHAPTMPRELERICLHALEREPSERYRSLAEFAADLEAHAENRPIALQPPSPARRAQLWLRRHRRRLVRGGLVAAAVLALLAAGSVAFLMRDRARLRATHSQLLHDLSNAGEPHELADLYHRADNERGSAEELDARTASLLFPPLGGMGDEALTACSDRLGAVLASALQNPMHEDQVAAVIARYRTVLDLDLRYCPESLVNDENRRRGTLTLAAPPPGWELSVRQLEQDSTLTRVEAAPEEPLKLPAGVYRLTYRDEARGTVRELDFESRPVEPHRRLEAAAPVAGLEDGMVPIAGSEATGPFLIATEPVRWDEYRRLFPEELARLRSAIPWLPEELAPEEPATIPWNAAMRYAARMGARLPTRAERALAVEQGVGFSDLDGEWTSTPRAEYRVCYRPQDQTSAVRRDASIPRVGARLVIPLPASD